MAHPRLALDHEETRARKLPSPWAMFLSGFLKHPVMVGSVIASSKALQNTMLDRVDWPNTKLFVEYGPGVGTFTQNILDRLAPDGTYIAIDTNEDFIDYLGLKFTDSRFIPVLGSAADVEKIVADHGFDHADYVLSGLPFSTLPHGVAPQIAAATHRVLKPGGAFLVYQFRPKVREFLTPHWSNIDYKIEWRAIPPSHNFWAWKDKDEVK
ncbi:methyltransferase domain-containing protein [Sphingomonas sp.]|uniref:class I SAM-dependent methyltransferase n=1 Tax=Sphingomonas sp. TaxID=28214 RepID=UPI0025F462AC|nr:methyltransferase domain-containing protein [Sphingomonas sp.]